MWVAASAVVAEVMLSPERVTNCPTITLAATLASTTISLCKYAQELLSYSTACTNNSYFHNSSI